MPRSINNKQDVPIGYACIGCGKEFPLEHKLAELSGHSVIQLTHTLCTIHEEKCEDIVE